MTRAEAIGLQVHNSIKFSNCSYIKTELADKHGYKKVSNIRCLCLVHITSNPSSRWYNKQIYVTISISIEAIKTTEVCSIYLTKVNSDSLSEKFKFTIQDNEKRDLK